MKTINKILAIGLVLCIALSIGCIDHEVEPKYKTVFTLELVDDGFTDTCYKIEDVYDFEHTQTGKDSWGNVEYMFDVYYYVGYETHHKRYYEINSADASNVHDRVVGYE